MNIKRSQIAEMLIENTIDIHKLQIDTFLLKCVLLNTLELHDTCMKYWGVNFRSTSFHLSGIVQGLTRII